MSILPTHRENEWKQSLQQIQKKARQGEPRYIDMDIVWDMDTQFSFNTTSTKILAGDCVAKSLFEKMGVSKCSKKDATLLIVIGEKSPCGCWVAGKYKNYWLK